MIHEVNYNGTKYWITIEPAEHSETKEQGFVVYISKEKPSALFGGETIKDGEGKNLFFTDKLTALTNANALLQSYSKY
jgi:hypothetical protein